MCVIYFLLGVVYVIECPPSHSSCLRSERNHTIYILINTRTCYRLHHSSYPNPTSLVNNRAPRAASTTQTHILQPVHYSIFHISITARHTKHTAAAAVLPPSSLYRCSFPNFRKCFHVAYYYLDDAPPCQGPSAPLIDWEAPVHVAGEVRHAVPVADFGKHVAELHADGDIGFSKEYESLQAESMSEEYASENSQHADNKTKNRYLNIIACELGNI